MATESRSTAAATIDHPKGQRSRISGRVVPYDTVANIGPFTEEFRRGAFRDSLQVTPNVPLLMYHDDRSDPIGVATDWDDRADGLHGTFRLDDAPRAQEAARLTQGGLLSFMSIRFAPDVRGSEWIRGEYLDHVVRTRARLLEVSLVSTPAYALATVTEVRASDPRLLLARDLGAPAMRSAITGDAGQIRTAADLVRLVVEECGVRAADELHGIAAATRDPDLSTNLARAAMVLEDVPDGVGRLRVDRWRSELARLRPAGVGSNSPTAVPTARRRRLR